MSQNLLQVTSMLPQVLVTQQDASGEQTVYTCPASSTVKITQGTICNTSGAAVTTSVAVVRSGGTADGTHRVIAGYPLAAGDTLPLRDYLLGVQLGPGDFISVNCSVGSAVDVVLCGVVCA